MGEESRRDGLKHEVLTGQEEARNRIRARAHKDLRYHMELAQGGAGRCGQGFVNAY
ncbi:hypothetical protein HanXRQr2_Chr11g0504161 [Helianthus annuus]|uniref:Uncharacterized protein n=1 Tax=Helianthus annuus TaxID=4232 RepID=A0A251TBN3_HELAN|nr:hypothetical protein HanXRQr2_Chr11g0504161 [Helianthus annuus]KAJ0876208.1 hypothetical protein HanPSC8_Chr11g0485791 [Helianthus annuus]